MKVKYVVLAAAFLLTLHLAIGQPTPSQRDIDLVRRDYLVLPYLLELSAFTNEMESANGGELDTAKIQKQLAANAMSIKLSDIDAGPIEKIADRPVMSEFRLVPAIGEQVLNFTFRQAVGNDEENSLTAVTAAWAPNETDVQPQVMAANSGKTVKESMEAVGITGAARYVTAMVEVSYQGHSQKYRIAYFFAANSDTPLTFTDPFMAGAPRYSQHPQILSIGALLHSKYRSLPLVKEWLATRTLDCRNSTLCCVENKCGISRSDLARELSEPTTDKYPFLDI